MNAPPPGPSGHLLHHGQCQFASGRLDLVLGLQVCHALCADPVDGRDDVTLGQAAPHRLAAWSYLQGGREGGRDSSEKPAGMKDMEES